MDTKHYQSLTLVDVAYEALKKDIAEKTLQPGQKLIIRELHERYGISDTPIKQALNRLIIEGLVENVPRRGMKVKELLWEEIEELMDIRLMIETYYAKTIIQNLKKNSELKKRLMDNLKEHRHIAQHVGSYSDFLKNYQLDQEFHRMLVTCTENSKIIQIYKNLGTHVYGNYIYGQQSKEEIIPGVQEHELIFTALADEDEVKLRNALEAHIMNAKIRNKKLFNTRA